ncbi:MAG: valine--tRNA ligase, partial [Candidatus Saccharimonadaceae bacterium]
TMDQIGEVVIATTRPETMLGDTALAVHPDDERYKQLVGTKVMLPLTGREIPIIADEHVDPAFGTGVVKVTPAHDPNDFEIGERHSLQRLQVIATDGTMINVPPQFSGKTVEEARERVLKALEIEELRRGEEDIVHSVGHCYKCGTIIQPLIKDQWFVSVKPLVERAKAALDAGEINFTPASKKRVLIQYLDNLRDWNISRQIPWGIPIPAFYNRDNPIDWIFDDRVEEQSIVVNGTTYIRDEDTFDTWFSSGQWPFIVTDYQTDGKLKNYYPTDLMETAGDILYAWVARMVMLGLYATDQVPFRHVYLHGLVLDEKGIKMSKSKGNVINPMEAVAEYGSDALRLGIVGNRSAAQDQAFSLGKVQAGRNFCNKLWNIARYITDKVGEVKQFGDPSPSTIADHWIVKRLNEASNNIDKLLADYRFAEAMEVVYHTIWDDVADWYIESSKTESNSQMLAWVLDTCLKLAHPFAPFVTETIWQSLVWHDDLLIKQSWPTALGYNDIAAVEFKRLQQLIVETRFVAADLPGNTRQTLLYQNDSLIEDYTELIKRLAKLKSVEKVDRVRGLHLAATGRDAWLDVDAKTMYEHQTNLETRLAEAHADIERLESRLSNENYTSKAPTALVEETRSDLAKKKDLAQKLVKQLEVLEIN